MARQLLVHISKYNSHVQSCTIMAEIGCVERLRTLVVMEEGVQNGHSTVSIMRKNYYINQRKMFICIANKSAIDCVRFIYFFYYLIKKYDFFNFIIPRM